MAKYMAILIHGKYGGEGRYEFSGPDDLLAQAPFQVMRAFMDSAEGTHEIGHIDYEINAALKNKERGIVTVIGEVLFEGADRQPFMCMLSRADAE